jgi:O-antigen/teichoic acid export membrane protein
MFKQGIYNAISGIARAIFMFIAPPIMIKFMGVENYGVWTLISSVLSIGSLAEAGLPVSATVFVSKDIAKKDTGDLSSTLTIIYVVSTIIAVLASVTMLAFSGYISSLFSLFSAEQKNVMTKALALGSISIFFQVTQQCLVGIEQAYQKYKLLNAILFLQWVLLPLGWIILVYLGKDILSLISWQVLITILSFIAHAYVVKNICCPNVRKLTWDREKAIEIAKYSFVSWITTVGRTVFTRGDRIVVGFCLGSEKVAIYSVLLDLVNSITFFSSIFVQPLTAMIAELVNRPEYDKKMILHQVRSSTYANVAIASAISLLISLLASPIIKLTLHSSVGESSETTSYLRIAATIYFFIALNATGYWILFAVRKVTVLALIQMIFGVLSLLLIAVGSKYFGLLGAILGNIGYVGTILLPIVALKELEIPITSWLRWTILTILITSMISLIAIFLL